MIEPDYKIAVGTGFYYEELTGFMLAFSDDFLEWCCDYRTSILVVPFFDHPEHEETMRHEVMHAKMFNHFKQKHPLIFFLWVVFRNTFLLGSFNEIITSILSRSLSGFVKSWRNMLTLIMDLLLLLVLFLSLTINYYLVLVVVIVLVVESRRTYDLIK